VATRPIKISIIGDDSNLRKSLKGASRKLDAFYPPQPYPSWSLDENYLWQRPTPMPTNGNLYVWYEATTSWVEATA
jgi:hypothetical protein